ncbi:MAG: acyltransferase [Campylobacterales bacterium]|nr:acyltransferase [Campylobacterales bacterium]
MPYRKDIQILRGVSVLFVVLFHLDIGVFKSGFLGVDVFFVISGFLMAMLYDHQNIKHFFARRALRLLPTYFMIVLVTLYVSSLLVTPNEFSQVIDQSLFATFFSSNIGFWLQNSYFSKIEFNPLLHLWSLGVEIQFYLIIPILFFFFRLNRYFLLLFLLFSLSLSAMVLGISPKTSFFMMPLRIWEFLLGYGVAFYFTTTGVVKQRDAWFQWGDLGLLIILFIPMLNVQGDSLNFLTGHPGFYALLITVATASVLLFGLSDWIEKSIIGTLLEGIGKYSYSIYLVHFPVIVLYLYQPFSGTILKPENWIDTLVLIALIVPLSVLSYHLFEEGLRKSKHIKIILWSFPVWIFLFIFVGLNIQKNLFDQSEQRIANAFKDRDVYRCGKLNRILDPKSFSCNLTQLPSDEVEQRILLLGDSHADAIKYTFEEEAKSLHSDVWFLVYNEALLDASITPQRIVEESQKDEIERIVIHYSFRINKHLDKIKELVRLAESAKISVDFIMPIPTWKEHIPKVLWEYYVDQKALPIQTLDQYEKKHHAMFLSLLPLESDHFKIHSTAQFFCQQSCQYIREDGTPLYFDNGHLTITGSQYLAPLFRKIIQDNSKN